MTKPAYGPKRFFFYSLFESDQTGAPLAVRNRAGGSIDAYAAAVGRWLVTRDGFDFLAYYLSDFDYASHAHGPEGAEEVALARTDAAIQALLDAAGGADEFLDRYAVIVHSDHGQTTVERAAQLELPLAAHADSIVVTASNRAGQVYLLPDARVDAATLARALDAEPSVETTLRLEGDEAVARREGEELRFRPAADGWETSGDAAILDYPDALQRSWSALANPNAGELLVSAARGLGVRRHRRPPPRGRRQPRLARRRRLDRPVLTVGVDAPIERITDVTPAVLAHFTPCPRRLTGARWSSASCARAASTTSACLRRWSACRASCSCRPSCASARTTTRRCRSARTRRSRSRTWWRASAPSCSCSGGEKVLDVGTGSGYQAAVLAELGARGALARADPGARRPARAALAAAGYGDRVHVARRRRHPRPARARRRSAASPSRPPPGGRRPRSSSSSSPAAGS